MPITARRSASASSSPRPSLLYTVKQLELVIRSKLDEILKPAGITALQYTALTVLDHHDGISAAELARGSFVTPQSMSDMISNLERRDLVRRERHPTNGRELVIRLAPEGQQLLARHASDVRDLEDSMTAQLDADDTERFRAYLNRCRKALSDDPALLSGMPA